MVKAADILPKAKLKTLAERIAERNLQRRAQEDRATEQRLQKRAIVEALAEEFGPLYKHTLTPPQIDVPAEDTLYVKTEFGEATVKVIAADPVPSYQVNIPDAPAQTLHHDDMLDVLLKAAGLP